MSLTNEEAEALKAVFAEVGWKPQKVIRERRIALAVAYIDARDVMDRLDSVVGYDGWTDAYDVLAMNPHWVVRCRLTVKGITHEDVGEGEEAKDAFSDALKRAAVKFGVGRYLYGLPRTWVEYDPDAQQFTPKAVAQLQDVYGKALDEILANSDGDDLSGQQPRRGSTRPLEALGGPSPEVHTGTTPRGDSRGVTEPHRGMSWEEVKPAREIHQGEDTGESQISKFHRQIMAQMGKLGLAGGESRDRRLSLLSSICKKEVNSTKDLTGEELQRIVWVLDVIIAKITPDAVKRIPSLIEYIRAFTDYTSIKSRAEAYKTVGADVSTWLDIEHNR